MIAMIAMVAGIKRALGKEEKRGEDGREARRAWLWSGFGWYRRATLVGCALRGRGARVRRRRGN
eukprot:4892663-Pyramimonas_sp.AAC.2